MKKSTSLLLIVGFLALATNGLTPASPPPFVAADSEVNHVGAQFRTAWIYELPEDIFTNSQVAGRKWWQASLLNNPDETGAAVTELSLQLGSPLAFDNLNRENLVTSGPPAYAWSFGDVPEGSDAGTWVDSVHDSNPVPVSFSPGFDASRSADRTEFTEPDTQTLTITLTPREVTEGFSVLIQAEENDVVTPVITSPARGAGVLLRQEGHSLHIIPTGLQLNATWMVTVTIQVAPKASKVVFMPYIMIGWEGEAVTSGAEIGRALSHPLGDPSDEAGTWTWSAEGTYEWQWEERISRDVSWPHTSERAEEARGPLPGSTAMEEPGNHVEVGFVTNWVHGVEGDGFANAEVIGQKQWRISDITNTPDTTGAPVTGLKVTLESDLAFDWVKQDWLPSRPGVLTQMGPPVYEWVYDDAPEEVPEKPSGRAYDAYVGFVRHTSQRVAPGFDVFRSFDKTVFTAPDTQTMTVTVIPREERVTYISIGLSTWEDDRVDPVIVSLAGAEDAGYAQIEPGGRTLGVYDLPVALNTPVSVAVTTKITPKVSKVEYKPNVRVSYWLPDEPSSFTVKGSSFSYTMDEVGTWTVSAEGDYVWHWQVFPHKYGVAHTYSVGLDPVSRQPGEDERAMPEGEPQADQKQGRGFSWIGFLGLVAAMVIAGVASYMFIRRRLMRRSARS